MRLSKHVPCQIKSSESIHRLSNLRGFSSKTCIEDSTKYFLTCNTTTCHAYCILKAAGGVSPFMSQHRQRGDKQHYLAVSFVRKRFLGAALNR
jgi:hypothetical protein